MNSSLLLLVVMLKEQRQQKWSLVKDVLSSVSSFGKNMTEVLSFYTMVFNNQHTRLTHSQTFLMSIQIIFCNPQKERQRNGGENEVRKYR
mmetsp:Transcript_16409/g.22723  ORF Transcript_16409/g.22723 Transcript_16409/m.22723 type:complete len:90 (+) Transcript_16409:145-414(+)